MKCKRCDEPITNSIIGSGEFVFCDAKCEEIADLRQTNGALQKTIELLEGNNRVATEALEAEQRQTIQLREELLKTGKRSVLGIGVNID